MKATTAPSITGTVQATCGCAGTVIDAGTRLSGPNAIVSVKVRVPCETGHPERIASGVIERFTPDQVTPGGIMWPEGGAHAYPTV